MEIRRVLVVDDDAAIRTICEVALTRLGGWDVTTASSGDEAVSLAYRIIPDLILLDVMMPGCDGVQTLVRLRSDTRTALIPVLFLTAKVLPGEVGSYLEAGAQGVIAKPFDPVALPDEIRRLVSAGQIDDGAGR